MKGLPVPSFLIEIIPQKPAYDPLAHSVSKELVEEGVKPSEAAVSTHRLYRLKGPFRREQIQRISQTLLVDPVVETAAIHEEEMKSSSKPKTRAKGWVLDVWPKEGVTDPVGQTIEKGLKDLGFSGPFHATSGQRYVFPKMKEAQNIKNLALRSLANQLIHDTLIRQANKN